MRLLILSQILVVVVLLVVVVSIAPQLLRLFHWQ